MGVETVGLRYFNVFGPRQDPNSEYAAVIPRFILWGRAASRSQVHGDGTQSRDFTYIDNVVSANLLAARADAARASGRAYNVGCGSRTSLLEIITMIEKLLGKTLRRQHSPGRVGDVPHTLADVSAAKRDLGYAPLVDFDEGLRRTVDSSPGGNRLMTRLRHAHRRRPRRAGRGARRRAAAQTPGSLVIQVPTEPPGLDLTSNPSSAIAAVVFDNVQEGLIKIDRTARWCRGWPSAGTPATTRTTRSSCGKASASHNGREMKAADVKFALDRAVNPETKHPYRRAVRGDPGRHRQGRLHGDGGAEEDGRHLPLYPGAPGLGHLSPRGGGHPQEPADGHRARSRCRSGCAATASCCSRTRTTG